MHSRIKAERQAQAIARLGEQLDELAGFVGADTGRGDTLAGIRHNDPGVAELFRLEALVRGLDGVLEKARQGGVAATVVIPHADLVAYITDRVTLSKTSASAMTKWASEGGEFTWPPEQDEEPIDPGGGG